MKIYYIQAAKNPCKMNSFTVVNKKGMCHREKQRNIAYFSFKKYETEY